MRAAVRSAPRRPGVSGAGQLARQQRVVRCAGQPFAFLMAERADLRLALELDAAVVPVIDAQTELFAPEQTGRLIAVRAAVHIVEIQAAHLVAARAGVRVGAHHGAEPLAQQRAGARGQSNISAHAAAVQRFGPSLLYLRFT